MTIKPFGAVVEVWSGWGCRTSRTKVVPVDQLPFVTKQLHEQTAAWCKHSFELRSITLCRHDEAMAEIERLRHALSQIVDRSHNGELGTAKVIDMRRIAERGLAGEDSSDD